MKISTERPMPHNRIRHGMQPGETDRPSGSFGTQKLENGAIHRWYRFVLAYPDHYVRSQLKAFHVRRGDLVLDPFVGSGTTCVECKVRGYASIGIDAHPFFVFAAKVKTTWDVDVESVKAERASVLGRLKETIVARTILDMTRAELDKLADAYPPQGIITPKYVSPLPLAKCFVLRALIDEVEDERIRSLFRLALATTFVSSANVEFGPEIGLTKPKRDAAVLETFAARTAAMIEDLGKVNAMNAPEADVWVGDSRTLEGVEKHSVSAIITSPPYPVDKDYTRQIRLESAILGFVTDLTESRKVKERMIRASTRQIYAGDKDTDLVRGFPEVVDVIHEIKRRSKRDGDTSGFAKQYPRLVGEYFGGMKRHLEAAFRCLKPGGRAAYVVGDSRSFKMVHIETAEILARIGTKVGFRVEGIALWRDRRSTAHEESLPENILVLKRP